MKPFSTLVFLLIFLFTQNLSGQSVFGFRFGGVSSSLNPHRQLATDAATQFSNLSDLLAYQFGMGMSHRLGRSLLLDTDLTYSQKGYQFSDFFNFPDDSGKMTLYYLNLPVSFQYFIGRGKIALLGGGQLSYLLDHRFTRNGAAEDLGRNWKPLDLTVDFGFAFHWREDLKLTLSYQLGLRSVNDFRFVDSRGQVQNEPQLRSRAFQLSVHHYLVP